MSSKDNKPDLSHLKSRLGLKKSGNKSKESGPKKKSHGSGGQATISKPKPKKKSGGGGVNDRLAALKKSTLKSQPEPEPEPLTPEPVEDDAFSAFDSEPAQPQARQQPQQPQGGEQNRRGHGPPVGAQGPPPTAMAPPKRKQPSAGFDNDSQSSAGAEDVSLDQVDLDGGSMFSLPVLILFLVLFIIGGAFGLFFAEANQSRQIETTRINDAQSMLDELEGRFSELRQAIEIIEGLDPQEVDFEAAAALAELDFWVDAGIYPNNRMLMGEEILRPLNRYVAESNVLTFLLDEHQVLTSRVDREELEAFKEHSEGIEDGRDVGVVIMPVGDGRLEGVLVLVDEEAEPDEDDQIEVHVIAAGTTDRVQHQRLMRLDVSDFYNIDADNALQRYARRVNRLKHHAEEIEGRMDQIESSIGDLAASDPSPLLSF